MTGVPTGFTDFDALTNGLHPGQMIVIAARPAMGKSTIGLDIVRSAAIKHKMAAVVFSLEMSRTEITMRLLSAEAGIRLQHMRKGTMREEDWTRLASTMGRVSDAPLFIDDSPNMSLMEIRAKCRRLKQRENLKARRHRLPPGSPRLGQARRVAPAGGLGVLPCPRLLAKEPRGAGHRDLAPEPWSRAAHRQEARDERPP